MADHNSIVTAIELKHDVRAIQSEASSLYYLEDDDKKQIGILAIKDGIPMHVILSKNQAYTLAKEFKAVCVSVLGGEL